MSGSIILCGGPRGVHRRVVFRCPTCDRRSFGVECWDGAWYGTTLYCAVCLDYFQDGYRGERPFRRGWKVDRAAEISALWASAMMPAAYKAWTRRDIELAIGGGLA